VTEAVSSQVVSPEIGELTRLMERMALREGITPTSIPGVSLIRYDRPGVPMPIVYAPSVCIAAQGSKLVTLGRDRYLYDRSRFIVASVDLPGVAHVQKGSPAEPYLCVSLELNPRTIASVLLEESLDAMVEHPPARGMFVGDATPSIVGAVVRLLRLADTPEDTAALAPLVEREIVYRLLRSAEGWRLAQMARGQGHARRIARSIAWIKSRFAEPLRVDRLAAEANMSVSSFHAHFKQVTAMSPLQYQKHLRLHEARRLLMDETVDAATAGHLVGYESPSQFSREYRRAFGAPPATDARGALRSSA
jgi:AraC-like DNA-binding protein